MKLIPLRMYNRYATMAAAAMLMAFPAPQASAETLSREASPAGFEVAQTVGDDELSNMRGGFIDMNGMLIDFSFMTRIAINDTVQSNINVTAANLEQAAASRNNGATTLQDLIPPAIIQNASNDTHIALQRILDLNIQNFAASMAHRSQFDQAALQNARAFH